MDAAARLTSQINGYRISQAIYVAARLRLSDHLAGGPLTAAELAQAAQAHPGTLLRLMRTLVAADFYAQLEDGRFDLAPMGRELLSNADSRLADWAVFVGRPFIWQAWGALEHSVRTGENAYAHVHGSSVWQHRGDHPGEGALFDAAMTALSRPAAKAMLDAYDFTPFHTVADIGGGHGAILAAVLTRYPDKQGLLFDQPSVVKGASGLLESAGVADRCRVEGGDFFAGVPAGADAYLLKSIVHDWPDQESIAILRRCAEAMNPGGVVLIIERMITGPPYVLDSVISDLNMLVGPGGQERTQAEYDALAGESGLRLTRAIPTARDTWLIECRRAD